MTVRVVTYTPMEDLLYNHPEIVIYVAGMVTLSIFWAWFVDRAGNFVRIRYRVNYIGTIPIRKAISFLTLTAVGLNVAVCIFLMRLLI